jgi:hypothetical protein
LSGLLYVVWGEGLIPFFSMWASSLRYTTYWTDCPFYPGVGERGSCCHSFFFWDRVLLCASGWLWTQTWDPAASTTRVLGLQVGTTHIAPFVQEHSSRKYLFIKNPSDTQSKWTFWLLNLNQISQASKWNIFPWKYENMAFCLMWFVREFNSVENHSLQHSWEHGLGLHLPFLESSWRISSAVNKQGPLQPEQRSVPASVLDLFMQKSVKSVCPLGLHQKVTNFVVFPLSGFQHWNKKPDQFK